MKNTTFANNLNVGDCLVYVSNSGTMGISCDRSNLVTVPRLPVRKSGYFILGTIKWHLLLILDLVMTVASQGPRQKAHQYNSRENDILSHDNHTVAQ